VTTEIQQNRYDQLLRRVGGLIGPGAKVSEVLAELFPMIDVENVPAELLILAGTRTCMGGGAVSGAAGTAPKFQLFNPVGSGMIITITRIVFSVNGDVIHRWGRSNVSFAARISTETFTDTRNPVVNLPVGQIHQVAAAALASATMQARVLALTANEIWDQNAVAILSPGFGFEIGSGSNNVTASCAFNWRERVAEASELSL